MGNLRSGKVYSKKPAAKHSGDEVTSTPDLEYEEGDRLSPMFAITFVRIIVLLALTVAVSSFFFPEETKCITQEISKIIGNSFHGALISNIINFGSSIFIGTPQETPQIRKSKIKQFKDDEFVEFEFIKDDDVEVDAETRSKKQNVEQSKGDPIGYNKEDITDERDFSIRNELDAIDDLFDRKKYKTALSAYNDILTIHPDSLRARYGKGLTLEKLSQIKKSNELLEQSIDELHQIIFSKGPVPKKLLLAAGIQNANSLSFRGWTKKGVETLNYLLNLYPSSIEILNKMGVLNMMNGDNEKAKTHFLQVLNIDPNNSFAMVHMAFISKLDNKNYEKAIRLYRKGMKSADPEVHHGRFYVSYGDALYKTGRHEEAHALYKRAAENGIFMSQWQRSLYNCDGVTSRAWWTKEQTGAKSLLDHLEKNWEIIREDALNIKDNYGNRFTLEDEDLTMMGTWSQFNLFIRGKKIEKNCILTPNTCAMLDLFKYDSACRRGQIKFSLLQPKVQIWPHTGPTNCRIRAHLGLVVPKEETPMIRVGPPGNEPQPWLEGKFIIFDDSFEHEVWNNGSSFRLILIIDLWHPELTMEERNSMPAM